MNLLRVPVASGGLQIGGSVMPLERDQLTALAAEHLDSVTLGLRPEQLKVASEDDSDEGGLLATVDLVEELGNESYPYAHLDNTAATDLDGEPAAVVARSQHRAPARIGQRVTLRKQGGITYLFHPETGRRIGD